MAEKIFFDTNEANNMLANTDPAAATPLNVKEKFLYKDANTKNLKIGTMPKNPPTIVKINPQTNNEDFIYTIPEGYHTGNGKVYTGKLSEYTYGNATSDQILKNKVAWVNGERVVGSLDIEEAEQTGTATSNDLLEGKTAWVNHEKLVGTIPSLPRRDRNLRAGESYTIPYGLSAGTTIISASSLSSQTVATASSEDILIGETAWVNGEKVTGTLNLDKTIEEKLKNTDTERSQVIVGKKFYSGKYNQIVSGTMPDHSSDPARTIEIGQSFAIPEGYYNGQIIKTKSLTDATQASAKSDDILLNKTAWVKGQKITGTMPINESTVVELNAGDSYDIQLGYHSGNGKIIAKSLEQQTPGTATPSTMVYGKTAWVNGEKIIGEMPNIYPVATEIGPGETFYIPEGYHSGAGTVWSKDLTELTEATALQSDILIDKTAWVNGHKIVGLMPNNISEQNTILAGETVTIPKGYHDGNGSVTAKDLASQTVANATANDILLPKTAYVNGEKIIGALELQGTAYSSDVLLGKTFYNVDAHQQVTGTLALAGSASESDVLSGVSFYSDDPKRKRIGSLSINGTATPDNVLTGTTFYNTDVKNPVFGTMPNNGAITIEAESGVTYPIPKGYHNGNGYIKTPSIGTQTPGTAEPNDIYQGKTAWVDGVQLTGSMTLDGDVTPDKVAFGYTYYATNPKQKLVGTMNTVPPQFVDLYAGESFNIPQGLHTGDGRITARDLASQTVGTADSSNIFINKTAWVNGIKVVGSMPDNGAILSTLNAGESYNIQLGYHNGNGKIIARDLASQTVGTADSSNILIDQVAWVNGDRIVGSMPDNGAISSVLNAGESYDIQLGYHNGNGRITARDLASQTVGTADSSNILTNKTAWVNGIKVVGSMPDNGSVSSVLNAGESYDVPLGYHNGNGRITARDLASQTVGTADSSNILIDQVAWVNGDRIVGSMPDNGAISSTLSAGESYDVQLGYHNGNGKITARDLASQTVGTANSSNILINKTAWVNGSKVVGSMPDRGAISSTLSAGESYDIQLGYHNGNGQISALPLDVQTPGTASEETILAENTAWVNGVQITGNIPTQSYTTIRISAGKDVTLPAGYYPEGLTIYALYTDRLDLTGTNAWYNTEHQALEVEDVGYVDEEAHVLVITEEPIV